MAVEWTADNWFTLLLLRVLLSVDVTSIANNSYIILPLDVLASIGVVSLQNIEKKITKQYIIAKNNTLNVQWKTLVFTVNKEQGIRKTINNHD